MYSTVDRRYFHVNVPGGEQYQEINLQPGYQRMCGTQAVQFVSYRHDDTSLVRDARDQSFLLDVKQEYGPSLAGNVHEFETIFGKAVQTDPGLHSTSGLLNLLGTLISSSGRRVRQVQFQASLGPSVDTASPQQIAGASIRFCMAARLCPEAAPRRSPTRFATTTWRRSYRWCRPAPRSCPRRASSPAVSRSRWSIRGCKSATARPCRRPSAAT